MFQREFVEANRTQRIKRRPWLRLSRGIPEALRGGLFGAKLAIRSRLELFLKKPRLLFLSLISTQKYPYKITIFISDS